MGHDDYTQRKKTYIFPNNFEKTVFVWPTNSEKMPHILSFCKIKSKGHFSPPIKVSSSIRSFKQLIKAHI